MYRLTTEYRTKSEAKAALKSGTALGIVKPDGTALPHANGDRWPIRGKIEHYKEWTGTAAVWDGKVTVIR